MNKKTYVLRSSKILLRALEDYKDRYFESGGFIITDEFEETDESLEEKLSNLYDKYDPNCDDSYKAVYDPNHSLQIFGVQDEEDFKKEILKESNYYIIDKVVTVFLEDDETTDKMFHMLHLYKFRKSQLKVIKLNGEEICVDPKNYLINKYTNSLVKSQQKIYVAISGILNVYNDEQKNVMTCGNESAYSDCFSGDVFVFPLESDKINVYIKNVIDTYFECKEQHPDKNVLPPTIMGLMDYEVDESIETKNYLYRYGIEMRGKRYPDLVCINYRCDSKNPTLQEIADTVPVRNYAKFSYCPCLDEETVFLSLFNL